MASPTSSPAHAKFTSTKEEMTMIRKIASKAQKLYKKHHGETLDLMSLEMDLDATNSNGCPMDFAKLLAADNFNLMHDVIGIANHIDRSTGELKNCFLPRCSK